MSGGWLCASAPGPRIQLAEGALYVGAMGSGGHV